MTCHFCVISRLDRSEPKRGPVRLWHILQELSPKVHIIKIKFTSGVGTANTEPSIYSPMKFTVLYLLSLFAACLTQAAEKPNIILFITDDQSPIAGCYGNKVIKTPNLDALAAEGTTFTEAFATTASCSASRSVILTGIQNHANGQFGHTHDYHHFTTYKTMAALSLPLQLVHHGYRTATIGKYHVAPESVYHFENYLRSSFHKAVGMANGCESFISEESDQPFFLYFATHDPHRSGGVDKTSPLTLKANLFGNLAEKKHHRGVNEVFYDPNEVVVPEFLPDTPECREEIAQYYQSCSRVDQGLGRLIEILKKHGKWDNTIIIFSADHGMAFPGAKTTVYEAGLRVPFVVRDPKQKNKGVVNNALISHVDITPTILDMAGGYDVAKQAPKTLLKYNPTEKFENQGHPAKKYQGRSWYGLLGTEESEGWDHIMASHTFHEIQMYYPMRVYRDRKYKLIWNIAHGLPYPFASDLWIASSWQAQYQQGKDAKYGNRTVDSYINRPEFELFDIQKDPAEANNLASDPAFAKVLEEYKEKLKKVQRETRDPWRLKWSYE
ncbi:ulvan-active sulfatase [Rubritalea halochordaticola]|uniref:Ulvan-active sulfatase n=2 Tax=Rubritalea halochordaticola TaxID=714537 RepID=A0ABP9V2N7_9BACT